MSTGLKTYSFFLEVVVVNKMIFMIKENDTFNSQILNLISDQLNFVQKSVMITPCVREKKFVSMVNAKKAAQMIMIANEVKTVTKTNVLNPVIFLENIAHRGLRQF